MPRSAKTSAGQLRHTRSPQSRYLDEKLSEYYARLASLPLPERMIRLLDELERRERSTER